MPVYVEQSILALDRIYINGGRRGYLVGLEPRILIDVLLGRQVNCAIDE
jgi:prolyl-tRNA editing enzyme YbaK/EbsC (Cys-tRNA(Pro) deacylase)